MPLVQVDDVHQAFKRGSTTVHALNGVSLAIDVGESVAIIGESGSGKSTFGRLVLGLQRPTAGTVHFDGNDVGAMRRTTLRHLRSRMSVVFQEPFQSLNPRMTVRRIIEEPLKIHEKGMSQAERAARVDETMNEVSLPPEAFNERYARQLSGGQQQRVGIARALVTRPRFIVLDEPTSSLDLSVRAQILQLLADLRHRRSLAYLFISHDIHTVEFIADRIAVMYLGRIVETGSAAAVFAEPRHPYTEALLSATLSADPDVSQPWLPLEGELPDATVEPTGCGLCGRCPNELPRCSTSAPPLTLMAEGHEVACFNPRGSTRPS